MSKYLLGIDNGSTVSKVALFATSGEEIATAARKVNLTELKPGWRENIGNGRGGRDGSVSEGARRNHVARELA